MEVVEHAPFRSAVNPRSKEFKERYGQMKELVGELEGALEQSLYQGKPEHIARHLQQGKLLARDRVELLLDEDSPFLELCPLSGYGQDGVAVGASVVGGIGLVSGIECLVTASVPTVKGGA